MTALKRFYYSLQNDNNRSFYLAFLRVAISVWLLKELCIDLPYLNMIYGADSFVVVKNDHLFKLLNVDVDYLRNNYQLLLCGYGIFIMLNILGIGKNITALLVFIFTEMFFRMNIYMGNGGIFMCRFILLYLVFADTYKYFTLNKVKQNDKQRSFFITNIAAYAIMIHLCLAYLISAVIKVQSPMWQDGTVMYYIFSQEAFNGTGHNTELAQHIWLVKFVSWYTLLFEFAFPFLVWFRKFRSPVILMGILLHAGIYLLMMIYGFQLVFLLIYGLFFTNEEWFRFIKGLRDKLSFKKAQ